MLNRRSLRIKAVQSIYAYREKVQSNYHIAIEKVKDAFLADFSMENPNYEELGKESEEAVSTFEAKFKGKEIKPSNEKIANAVREASNYLRELNTNDKKKVSEHMVGDTENIIHEYALYLAFLVELSDMGLKTHKTALSQNKFLLSLKEHSDVTDLITRKNVTWEKEDSIVKKIFREEIKESDAYKEYNAKEMHSFEEDKDFVIWVNKNILFKNELLMDFFEDLDLHWNENKKVVQSLVKKTIKFLTENDLVVFSLSENWDEDKEYLIDLYKLTADETEIIEDELNKVLKNWDMDRVASMDKIIIETALHEMINYPSIPVKVTLNEFIEVAKNYSTPKSKIFVNGILDKTSQRLLDSGVIKKSGRGLIDNK